MGLFRNIKSRLTMKHIDTLFWDKVNGKPVRLYEDCYGDKYMAQSIFGLRIPR